MNYIDLFAGAGGLSEGFHNAGFHPVAHVEMDKDACDTIRTRLAWYHLKKNNSEAYFDYLRQKITREQLYELLPVHLLDSVINQAIGQETRCAIFQKIDTQLALLPETSRQVDVIIGGPPCQTFSVAGRARKGRDAMEQDPRSQLYLQYAEFLVKYQPRMFVFENVLGMLTFLKKQQLSLLREAFLKAGYQMDVREWSARDFGVLQSRDRLVIIGWRLDQTQLGYPVFDTLDIRQREKYSVAEILANLPAINLDTTGKPKKGQAYPVVEYPCQPVPGEESSYIIDSRIREDCPVLTWHIARPQTETDREIYRLFISHWNAYGEPRLRYAELPERLKSHKNKTGFTDRFKVVAKSLSCAQTVVAHISKDGHYYIHPDYEQARSLSVREAARIQSFPDNFYFEGSRTSVLRQIGNAVPPLMATRIAESVKKALDGKGVFLAADSIVGKYRSGRIDMFASSTPLFQDV